MFKYLTIFLITGTLRVFSQHTTTDSLYQQLSKSRNDTNKINLLHLLANKNIDLDTDKGLEFSKQELELSKKLNFKILRSLMDVAYLHYSNASYKESVKYYQQAEEEAARLNTPEKEDNLGRINDEMASVYSQLQNYDAAIQCQKKAIDFYSRIGEQQGVNIVNFNMGNLYMKMNRMEEAIKQFRIAEKGFISAGDSLNLTNIYNSIGGCFFEKTDYEQALTYFQKSYELTRRLTPDDLVTLGASLQNIGETYGKLSRFQLGLETCLKAAEMFRRVNDRTRLYTTYQNIAELYEHLGDYKLSNAYYKQYVYLKDSVFNDDTKSTIHEMLIKYETNKKEQENKILAQDNEKKQQAIYFAVGGLILLLGLSFMIFKNNRQKTRTNKQLEEKNKIINDQKLLVEQKNKDIGDSIRYAQRIQQAILPPDALWKAALKKSFVLYLPKDILSGDFYWLEETADHIFIAAADCTGHGVPGALVSIVNYNLLNKAVLEKNITVPGEILDAVNQSLTQSLHQSYNEAQIKDGMDVSLLSINKRSGDIHFAGANNPIYVLQRGAGVREIKANKFPVGAFIEDSIQKFTTHPVGVSKGDRIYLFSDGFADQFGGPKGKKYKYRQLQDKLMASAHLSLDEQKQFMHNDFLQWKGNLEQVDDVLLIGFEV